MYLIVSLFLNSLIISKVSGNGFFKLWTLAGVKEWRVGLSYRELGLVSEIFPIFRCQGVKIWS